MTYNWEKKRKIKQAVMDAIEMANIEMPDGYSVAGISIVNEEAVEAAYFSAIKPSDAIWTMDVMKDIAGDANSQYEQCFGPTPDPVQAFKNLGPLSNDEAQTLDAAIVMMIGKMEQALKAVELPLEQKLENIRIASESARDQLIAIIKSHGKKGGGDDNN
jgi:hypothetical protein